MSIVRSVRGLADAFLSDNVHYVQIQTPLLEYTDLFSRSLGDGSDIVMKVGYNLLGIAFDDDGLGINTFMSFATFAIAGDVHV